MKECLVCKIPDRLAERIAHEFLPCLAESAGFRKVLHSKPNGFRDQRGEDFSLVISKKFSVAVQVKGYRILDEKALQIRIKQIRNEGMPMKKHHRVLLNNADLLRAYMAKIILEYNRLDLLINDCRIREEFVRISKELNLDSLLSSRTSDYESLVGAYKKLQHLFNIFDKAINHARKYPAVKLFFIINTTDGVNHAMQIEQLKKDCLPLIKKAMSKAP